MNAIRKINDINQKELDQKVSDQGSWHYDYKDTSYIFIGNLPTDLKEIDIITIFSQYGIPTHIHLVKDKETNKSRGFCYLKYQNYKSCILAIDNFNGIKIHDRNIKVDHVYYKIRDDQQEDDFLIDYSEVVQKEDVKEPKLLENDTKLLEYTNDEFKDPMEEFDEFKDPMEDYVKKSDRSRSHRSRSDRKERGHRSRSDRKERSDRSSDHKSSDHRSHRRRDGGSRDRERSPERDKEEGEAGQK